MKCKLFLAAACALLFAGAASSAHAGTIAFDTSGQAPVVLSNGVTVNYASYGSQSYDTSNPLDLTYAPSPIAVDYGTFTATGASTSGANITPANYQITLTVTLPSQVGGGGTAFNGTISGEFLTGIVNNVDTLQFVPQGTLDPTYGGYLEYSHTYDEDGIGTISWYFDSTNIGSSGSGPTYDGDMLGTVVYTTYTVPLPASALGGSALIGLLAIGKICKNRQLV